MNKKQTHTILVFATVTYITFVLWFIFSIVQTIDYQRKALNSIQTQNDRSVQFLDLNEYAGSDMLLYAAAMWEMLDSTVNGATVISPFNDKHSLYVELEDREVVVCTVWANNETNANDPANWLQHSLFSLCDTVRNINN